LKIILFLKRVKNLRKSPRIILKKLFLKYGFGIQDLGSEIRKKPIPDPGYRGQKGTVSLIRIRNTDLKTSCTVRYLGIGDQLIQLFVTDGVFALDVFH
jgi:hypothetical protein